MCIGGVLPVWLGQVVVSTGKTDWFEISEVGYASPLNQVFILLVV